jgi:hypothetical protein
MQMPTGRTWEIERGLQGGKEIERKRKKGKIGVVAVSGWVRFHCTGPLMLFSEASPETSCAILCVQGRMLGIWEYGEEEDEG